MLEVNDESSQTGSQAEPELEASDTEVKLAEVETIEPREVSSIPRGGSRRDC